jgi:aldose sugar dehydrogenase
VGIASAGRGVARDGHPGRAAHRCEGGHTPGVDTARRGKGGGVRSLARAVVLLALAGVLALSACGDDDDRRGEPDTRPAPTGTAPEGPRPPRSQTVTSGLDTPWAIARAGDVLLVTERPGRVRAIRDGALAPDPVLEPQVEEAGEGGLLGIAAHPEVEETGWVYLYATVAGAEGLENRITRYRLEEGGPAGVRLVSPRVVLDGIPAARIHNGGRLAFGPDGRLYAGAGDAGNPALSADPDSPAGAILRIADDGTIPGDNPFAGSPVWAYGLRNPQGLAWDADGNLYASDHGPTGEFGLCCLDELNLIERGGFYGWPFRAGEQDAADAGRIGAERPPDAIDPIATSGPDETWAPAGVAVLRGAGGPLVVMATLAEERLRGFAIDGAEPGRVTSRRVLLEGEGRLRAVVAEDDACVLFTTSARDGRGDPGPDDDRVLRTCPGEAR